MLGLYAFALGAMAYDPLTNKIYREHIEPKESEEERKRRLAKAEIERAKANGLKEFFYGEIQNSSTSLKFFAGDAAVGIDNDTSFVFGPNRFEISRDHHTGRCQKNPGDDIENC